MSKTVYLILCLLVPPVWGLFSYWLFDLVGKRLERLGPSEAKSIVDNDCNSQAGGTDQQ